MSISLVDKFNMIGSSSSKLSEGQSNFKEKLEDNLKFIMNKEADKFLFMNENFSSKNLLETPDFSAEKLDFSYFLKRASYSDPNEDSFVERFAETCRKFQINFVESSSEKNQTEKKKKVDLKATVKKKTIFDKDILLLEKNKNDLLLNEDQNGKAEIEEIKTTNKEKSFITHIVRDQNDKFLSFLTIFKQKKPEVYKKTLLHISNLLDKFDDKDFLNEPEKVRENLEKIRTSPDFIEHYNTEINMESSNSGLSEMKSNLSSFYDSMKKNNFGIDRNNNDDIFVRYYNEGLNTIEETTENFISKTDLNTNTNFQSKSVEKSSNQTPNFKKIDLEHEIDQKSLTLFRFITAKCGENKKKIKFADIVKNCDKSLKVQTFLELLKLNCHQNIQMSQEKIEKFGDVFIGLL